MLSHVRSMTMLVFSLAVAAFVVPAVALGQSGGVGAPGTTTTTPAPAPPPTATTPADPAGGVTSGTTTGGAPVGGMTAAMEQVVPGTVAKILPDGFAAAPAMAPPQVQDAIWAGNQLIGKPYIFGGGHASFISKGYDCSGSVSFALHGGALLTKPDDSSDFMKWGLAGPGAWITVYTNPGHAFMDIAGIRLDTSKAGDPKGKDGPRWRPLLRATKGFHTRHPLGL